MIEKNSREVEKQESPPVITLKAEDLKPGMKTARAIINKYGGILMPAGVILTQSQVNKLKKLSLVEFEILAEDERMLSENLARIKRLEANYQEKAKNAATLFKRAISGKIDFKEVEGLTEEVKDLSREIELKDLLSIVRKADEYTYTHLLHVGILANMFGHWLNLRAEEIHNLTKAGLLHDIGKAKIPDKILNKKGSLSPREYQRIKKHPLYGYEMVKEHSNIADSTAKGILTHHEKYNGMGYPLELRGKKIPLLGRILAIVDTFDAIVAERVYKPARSPFEALLIFREESFGHYDYELKKVFIAKMPECFVRVKVILNNGKEAEIVFINPNKPEHPIIKVEDKYIDLYNAEGLKIEAIAKGDKG